jgi:ABC-2 type transport system ATP-binding protein
VNGSPELYDGSSTRSPALKIDGLSKRYGDFLAVDNISLRVEAGDFFGFLGMNGAGKTTTINAIVGLAAISSGTIEIFGHDNVRDWRTARRLIGLAPQEYNFDRYLSIRDILIYQAGYYGFPARAVRERADMLLERFGLTSKARDTYVKLSGGMKRRLTLARALIHEPKLLILDEPTAGVDVELRIELWDLLRELNAAGTTIILTTHYLEEAESLCRNIAIIESGRIVAMEPTERLMGRHGPATLSVTLDREFSAPSLARGARRDGDLRTLHFDGLDPAQIAPMLIELEAAGYTIENVEFRRASLQDIFLELVRP